MKPREANAEDIHEVVRTLMPGDVLELEDDTYDVPVTLIGINGTIDKPIIIRSTRTEKIKKWAHAPKKSRGKAVFNSGLTLDGYRERANTIAAKSQFSGYYPSVGQVSDEAMLTLSDCKYIILEDLSFDNCWPTAVYLNECQNIKLSGLHFLEGTLAIGANGRTTRDIVVEDCFWKQDVSKEHDMWNNISWESIHGAANNTDEPNVNIEEDYRAWDGDFFRAWSVHSNFIIKNNVIEDAFNGIHFFSSTRKLYYFEDAPVFDVAYRGGWRSSANVLIENNRFTRVRDNVIEPEEFAWNWIVRQNTFADCYRPFSFEFKRIGWMYIYGNYGWLHKSPGFGKVHKNPDKEKLPRNKCSQFKMYGEQRPDAKIHVFNNSWYYERGKGIFPKNALGGLQHFNNAIGFKKPKKGNIFGYAPKYAMTKPGTDEQEAKEEERRFTRRWEKYGIRFDGDFSNDEYFPVGLLARYYQIGENARHVSDLFIDAGAKMDKKTGEIIESEPDLGLTDAAKDTGRSIAFDLEMPMWKQEGDPPNSYKVPAGFNVGAAQDDDRLYETVDSILNFKPEDWDPRNNLVA